MRMKMVDRHVGSDAELHGRRHVLVGMHQLHPFDQHLPVGEEALVVAPFEALLSRRLTSSIFALSSSTLSSAWGFLLAAMVFSATSLMKESKVSIWPNFSRCSSTTAFSKFVRESGALSASLYRRKDFTFMFGTDFETSGS